MTINRDVIAAYLDTQFASLATAIGQADADHSATGYGPDIDAMLRKLSGTAEADLAAATVEDGAREAAFALSEYYAARRIWRALSDRANIKVDDSQYDYRYLLTNAKALADDAAAVCAALGYNVDGRATKTPIFQVY